MALLRLIVLAAALALASAAAECDVCHLHYYHKDVSTKEVFGADVTQCREYQSESCCTAKTAKGVAIEGYLYGDGYSGAGCGAVNSKCQAFFIAESCFYECDKNMGKWRKHDDCSDKTNVSNPIDNGWQIEKMPVSATYMERWWEACKEEQFCAGPTKSIFEQKDCLALNKKNNNTAGCKRFGEVYASGKEVAEVMWGDSFKYEVDETKAYVMSFPEGTENPNNLKFTDKSYPATCAAHTVNVTHPHVDAITGLRITAEAAGCTADWHMLPNSGHPANGTATTSGAASYGMKLAAVLVSAAVMMLA